MSNPPKFSLIQIARSFVWTQLQRIFHQSEQEDRSLSFLALLIDGENISSELAAQLLIEAGKFGEITIRRVYGNWALPTMSSWQKIAFHYGLTPIHHAHPVVGKNATDIALVVDAMDLLQRGVRRFCLVSSDSDYTPLVRRLREAGCFVLIIGRPETLPALKTSCTVFVSTEQMLPPATHPKSSASSAPAASDASLFFAQCPPETGGMDTSSSNESTSLTTLLTEAYKQAFATGGNEWVSVQQLGTMLKRLDPQFTVKSYGSSTLSILLMKYPHLFQTQLLKEGHMAVRLKQEQGK